MLFPKSKIWIWLVVSCLIPSPRWDSPKWSKWSICLGVGWLNSFNHQIQPSTYDRFIMLLLFLWGPTKFHHRTPISWPPAILQVPQCSDEVLLAPAHHGRLSLPHGAARSGNPVAEQPQDAVPLTAASYLFNSLQGLEFRSSWICWTFAFLFWCGEWTRNLIRWPPFYRRILQLRLSSSTQRFKIDGSDVVLFVASTSRCNDWRCYDLKRGAVMHSDAKQILKNPNP